MSSLPPGYPGYVPDDGLTARPDGFTQVPEQPEVDELDPHDPLVNPPGAGLDGWSRRGQLVLAGNWLPLLVITALGYGVPDVVLAATLPHGLGPLTLGVLVVAYCQAVAWGAAVWTITQWATGAPPSMSGALAYGFRRSPLLFGLNLLVSLLLGVGTVALVLPGAYLWFATSLVMPAAIFRQERPVAASFGLAHRFFGPVLARVAVATGALLTLKIVLAIVDVFDGHSTGATLALTGVRLLVGVPLEAAAIVGLTLTHVEMTARATPITSASLLAAL